MKERTCITSSTPWTKMSNHNSKISSKEGLMWERSSITINKHKEQIESEVVFALTAFIHCQNRKKVKHETNEKNSISRTSSRGIVATCRPGFTSTSSTPSSPCRHMAVSYSAICKPRCTGHSSRCRACVIGCRLVYQPKCPHDLCMEVIHDFKIANLAEVE